MMAVVIDWGSNDDSYINLDPLLLLLALYSLASSSLDRQKLLTNE